MTIWTPGSSVQCSGVDALAAAIEDAGHQDEDEDIAGPPELTEPGLELWVIAEESEQERSITRQARLLAAFGYAWVDGAAPVPCPVCGRVYARSDIAEHLLGHR